MQSNFENEEQFLEFLRQHSHDKLVEMLTALENHTISLIENKKTGPQNVDYDREIQKVAKVMCRVKDIILEKRPLF